MGSTNKTANLQLSQFVSTDKPAWLSDYNGDMSKIDTAYGTLDASVGSYDSRITQVEEKADALTDSNTALTQKVNTMEPQVTANTAAVSALNGNVSTLQVQVGTLETNVSQAQSTATQAQSTATQAQTDVNFFKLSVLGSKEDTTGVTIQQGGSGTTAGTVSGISLSWALNSAGTYGKIYGAIFVNNVQSYSGSRIRIPAGTIPIAQPKAQYTINSAGIVVFQYGSDSNANIRRITSLSFTVNTDGSIDFGLGSSPGSGAATQVSIIINNSPSYFTDYGDSPIEELGVLSL